MDDGRVVESTDRSRAIFHRRRIGVRQIGATDRSGEKQIAAEEVVPSPEEPTCPGAWPGVWITSKASEPTCSCCPPSMKTSGTSGCLERKTIHRGGNGRAIEHRAIRGVHVHRHVPHASHAGDPAHVVEVRVRQPDRAQLGAGSPHQLDQRVGLRRPDR